MDISGFSDPWEHVRLLSDVNRNEMLLALLQHHAPGNRVLEVGCGTGLLSCVAAKLGARQVFAVEPTPLADLTRELVQINGLTQVTVLEDRIESLTPQPVDLAFSELLNADPFYEGIIDAMVAAQRWVVPGGRIAPSQLKVFVALTGGAGAAQDLAVALQQVTDIGRLHDLKLGPLEEALQTDTSNRFLSPKVMQVTPPTLAWSIPLGVDGAFQQEKSVSIVVEQDCDVGGAVVWFEADYGLHRSLHNAPSHPGHWGHLVFDWTTIQSLAVGDSVTLCLEVDDGELDVWIA